MKMKIRCIDANLSNGNNATKLTHITEGLVYMVEKRDWEESAEDAYIKIEDDSGDKAYYSKTRFAEVDEAVNHPNHYAAGRKYEPIEVINDWGLGFDLGNAVKYISRAGRKGDEVEDLQKALFYIRHYIAMISEEEEE